MARIKTYKIDRVVEPDDLLLGSDSATSLQPTRNYRIGDLMSWFTQNLADSIAYVYCDGLDPLITPNTRGFFFSDTKIVKNITKIYINEFSQNGTNYNNAYNSFIGEQLYIKIVDVKDQSKFGYFQITQTSKIAANGYFEFDVDLIGNLGYGVLTNEVEYFFVFAPIVFSNGVPAGDILFTEDYIVSLPSGVTFGKYVNGDTVPAAGKTAKEVLIMAAQQTLNPTFTSPSLNLTSPVTGTKEIGEVISVALSASFNRGSINGKLISGVWNPTTKQDNRSGAATKYLFNGVDNGWGATKTINNTTINGSNNFTAAVDFSQGPQPTDSAGNNYTFPFLSGQLTSTLSYTGAYKRFYGAKDTSVIPRNLNFIFDNTSIANTFDLLTGSTNKNFHIFLPPGRILDYVLSVEASNADITSQYILQGNVQVPDAGGLNVTYKHYKMTTDVPYGSSNTHRIKVKNG